VTTVRLLLRRSDGFPVPLKEVEPGLWTATDLPQGRYGISYAFLVEEAKVRLRSFSLASGEAKDITVHVPLGVIKGQVVDEETKAPLGGSLILVYQNNERAVRSLCQPLMSDGAGHFQTRDLFRQTYLLLARTPGYGLAAVIAQPKRKKDTIVKLAMKRSQGLTLTLETNVTPLPLELGVRIQGAVTIPFPLPYRVRADGTSLIDLAPGPYRLHIMAEGFGETRLEVQERDFQGGKPKRVLLARAK